jgi:hypothetical protein
MSRLVGLVTLGEVVQRSGDEGRCRLPSELIDEHRLVFVSGLHRSGTTPLARVLAQHPQVSGLIGTGVTEDEGQHLQSVYPPALTYGGAGRFARDPRAHLTEASRLATPENAARLLQAWRPYWDTSREVLLEKSPPNLVMTRFLQELFPDASFVIVVRHPVSVTLATHKWRSRTTLAHLLEHWFMAHDLLGEDLPFLRRVHVLKYEDLITRSEQVLSELGDFLGLTGPIPAKLVRTDQSTGYAQQWESMGASSRPWRRRQHQRLVTQFEPRANDYGYSLVDLDAIGPFPLPGVDEASKTA